MLNFLKTLFVMILIGLAGLMIFKKINWKPEKTQADFKREYNMTIKRMVVIATALDETFEETSEIPREAYVSELKRYVDRYASKAVLVDAWGNEFFFSSTNEGQFFIASAGSDGLFDGFKQKGEYPEYKGKDLIIERGGGWRLAPIGTSF
jgi:hypothetical protein